MGTIWGETVGREYPAVIDQLERALRSCPDALWESSLWEVKREHPSVWPVRRIDDARPGPVAAQERLLQVHSAFWNVAYHTLFHLDFYLSGGRLPFAPPQPFREDEHHTGVVPNRPYTREELAAYAVHVRAKARQTFPALTDAEAAELLPRTGQPFAELLLFNVLHTQEHASQLNLFLAQQGVEPAGGIALVQAQQHMRWGLRDRSDAAIDAFAKSNGGYARLLQRVTPRFVARLRPSAAGAVRFDLGVAQFVVRATPGSAILETEASAEADATVRVSPQDFLRWTIRDLDLPAAFTDGRIVVEGNAAAARNLFGGRPG